MKPFVLFTMFLSFAVPTVAVQNQPRSQQRASKSQSDTKYTDSPPAAITNNQATSYYQQQAPDKPRGWHKFFAWPEGITTWAIMLTLGAIVWQAWETRKATVVAKDSIKLQEIAYYQWLDVVNWSSSINTRSLTPKLDISVEVINRSNYPMTITEAKIAFGQKPSVTTIYMGENRFLPLLTPIPFSVTIDLTEERKTAYLKGSIWVPVEGRFKFIGVLKKPITQDLVGTISSGYQETTFESDVPMHPKGDNQES